MEEETKQKKEKRPRRTFTEEFKKQMVELYNVGKSRAEIVKEYELTASALDRWISRINKTGSSKEKDNLSDLEKELIVLKTEFFFTKKSETFIR
ncbi:transposase [Treponema sp.]|uniref:transposase n=1 Tax=Treponema sp. TaxID=166 RepID=UPI003FD84DB0